jgi:hypothetical protein
MTVRKTDIERVIPQLAIKALERAKDCGSVFTEYILLHYRDTGNLAPGCDNKDLIAWYRVNMLNEWKGKKR